LEKFGKDTLKILKMSKDENVALEQILKKSELEIKNLQKALSKAESDLENAKIESNSRPDHKTWNEAKYRIRELEIEINRMKVESDEAQKLRTLHKLTDTKALIRKDKLNHRLGLTSIFENVSLEEAKEVLGELCRILSISDISLLSGSVNKLVNVVLVMPRLRDFVEKICKLVFGENNSSYRIEQVIPIIKGLMVHKERINYKHGV